MKEQDIVVFIQSLMDCVHKYFDEAKEDIEEAQGLVYTKISEIVKVQKEQENKINDIKLMLEELGNVLKKDDKNGK